MLVLSREIGQELVIDVPGYSLIRVAVVDVRLGPKVRIGIDADSRIAVHRREVYDAIQRGEVKDTPIVRKEP